MSVRILSGRLPSAPDPREPSPAVSAVPASVPSARKPKWPLHGYAPGNYWCTCRRCGVRFDGDKYASSCFPCAIDTAHEMFRTMRSALLEVANGGLWGMTYDEAWKNVREHCRNAAQGTPTRSAETTGSVGEADGGPVPQECAEKGPS